MADGSSVNSTDSPSQSAAGPSQTSLCNRNANARTCASDAESSLPNNDRTMLYANEVYRNMVRRPLSDFHFELPSLHSSQTLGEEPVSKPEKKISHDLVSQELQTRIQEFSRTPTAMSIDKRIQKLVQGFPKEQDIIELCENILTENIPVNVQDRAIQTEDIINDIQALIIPQGSEVWAIPAEEINDEYIQADASQAEGIQAEAIQTEEPQASVRRNGDPKEIARGLVCTLMYTLTKLLEQVVCTYVEQKAGGKALILLKLCLDKFSCNITTIVNNNGGWEQVMLDYVDGTWNIQYESLTGGIMIGLFFGIAFTFFIMRGK